AEGRGGRGRRVGVGRGGGVWGRVTMRRKSKRAWAAARGGVRGQAMNTRIRLAVILPFLGAVVLAQNLNYPVTKKGDQVDVYHGTKVADPYRWLEDDNSKETAAWVEAENKVTFPYLEAIAFRAQMQARVKALNEYDKYTSPSRKGPYYFFFKTAGLQNQPVLYIQKGLDGTPEVLIDPNTW